MPYYSAFVYVIIANKSFILRFSFHLQSLDVIVDSESVLYFLNQIGSFDHKKMNTSMNETDDYERTIHDILAESFPVAFTAIGATLNLLSICGILGCKPLRKWKHVFVFNLSLSDFIASLGILISYLPRLHEEVSYLYN